MSLENTVRVVDIIKPFSLGIGRPITVKAVVRVAEEFTPELLEFAVAHRKESQEANQFTHGGYRGTIIEHVYHPSTIRRDRWGREIILNDIDLL